MSRADTRGFLTDKDKEWLRGEIDYEHRQSAANRRAAIRNRVAAALSDFAELNQHWTEKERRRTLDEVKDSEETAAEIIEFLYIWLNERAADPEEMVGDQADDNALAFRRALCGGIKKGKQHFGSAPDPVLIDSNTELFEIPSADELQRELNTSQWRLLNEYVRGTFEGDDDEVIDKSEAANQYEIGLQLAVRDELHHRRVGADSEMHRHDQMIRASIPQFDSE